MPREAQALARALYADLPAGKKVEQIQTNKSMNNYEIQEVDGVGWISSKRGWTGEDYAFLFFVLGIAGLILRFFGVI